MTKQEDIELIRRRFGDKVPIVERVPRQKELIESDSWLERIAGTVGLEKWMWKSRGGLLLAIVVVPPGINGLVDFWSPSVRVGIEYAKPYVSILEQTTLSLGKQVIAFLPEPGSSDREHSVQRAVLAPSISEMFPLGAGVFPIKAVVYRITGRGIAPLDGYGSTLNGGRWNPKGSSVLYTSNSVLAALGEIRRYLPEEVHPKMLLHEIRINANGEVVPKIDATLLSPENWLHSHQLGGDWIKRGQSDVLVAPSPIDPTASTIVVNLRYTERMTLEVVRSSQITI